MKKQRGPFFNSMVGTTIDEMLRRVGWSLGTIFILLIGAGGVEAALEKGSAPGFSALEQVKKNPLVLIYFFDLQSKPAREGLDPLNRMYGQYQKEGIAILAVTQESEKAVNTYLKAHPLLFPVIKDDGTIFKAYQVKVILPTTYILGPGARITDVLEGGGPSSGRFIGAIAERALQLKNSKLAEPLYQALLKSNSKDPAAKIGLGQIYLMQGKVDEAEREFSEIAQLKSPEALPAKEGIAEIYLKKGELQKAAAVADEVAREDPSSGISPLVRGKVLVQQGRREEALAEFNRAAKKEHSNDRQRATAYHHAARIYSDRGDDFKAEEMYGKAVDHDPYSGEILSDLGVFYEKHGAPKKALAIFEQALSVNPDDEIAKHFLMRAEQHLSFKEDLERQKRIDTLVSDLAERYKRGQISTASSVDPWSSRPMAVTFLGLKWTGGGLLREGLADILQAEMARTLSSGGRISVVEREILDQLLTELKLGSSELADPETALKIGKLLSARLIVTGSLIQVPDGIRMSLRVIDPETSAIKMNFADEMGIQKNLFALAGQAAQAIDKKIREQYPLKGKIAAVEEGNQVVINLGARHGVQPGTKLNVLDEGEEIVVGGKSIGRRKKRIGLLEIVEVEEGLSYGKLMEMKSAAQKDQKVLEEVGGNESAF